MKSFITISIILVVCLISVSNPVKGMVTFNKPAELLSDSLPYLGQTRPDTIPLRFGPQYLISDGTWGWHGSPKFSPDGKEMFFVKYYFNLSSGNAKMYVMKDVNGVWTLPVQPGFASDSIDNSPVYSPNGNKLYFSSYRSGSMKYYFVTRDGSGWSQPQLLNMAYQSIPGSLGWDFAMTMDSTIYFSVYTATNATDIYRSSLVNGQYSTFERLPSEINTSFSEVSPYIEPEEKYIIFGSNRPGSYGLHDVYISFKKTDGSWTPAQNMGNRINGLSEDSFPWVTPDGKYMFFNSAKAGDYSYNAYWVDSKVIDRFKPVGINKLEEEIPSGYRLFQNYPNPFNPSTKIKFQLSAANFVKLSVFDMLGRELTTLVNESLKPGIYEVDWNASRYTSGTYFYRLETDGFNETRQMLLIK